MNTEDSAWNGSWNGWDRMRVDLGRSVHPVAAPVQAVRSGRTGRMETRRATGGVGGSGRSSPDLNSARCPSVTSSQVECDYVTRRVPL
jgi:hypothetical protein